MKVYALPADAYGCGHYRIAWPADVLRQEGYDVTVMPPKEKSGFLANVSPNDDGSETLVSVRIPQDAELIVLQRPAHRLQPQMIHMMRDNGIAVVVDMDDDMSSIHPGNGAYDTYANNRGDPNLSWRHAMASCKAATLVTTSTRALQSVYAPHGRGEVLDNYVPAAYLDFPSQSPPTFGWPGTVKSHPNDLQMLGSAVRDLVSEGYDFRVVGDGHGVAGILRLSEEPKATGMVGLVEWASTIAAELGVGIVPLAPTSFNTAKSRLKGIELMAVGIPWISSPREEYRRLHRESGCGFLVDTPRQWYRTLKALLSDETLRKEQAETGRAYMREQTYQANAWRWAQAWQRAYDIQRGVSK
jgi:Glycosyl transferases group 1